MKNLLIVVIGSLLFFQCRESELINPQESPTTASVPASALVGVRTASNTVFVSAQGNNTGDGSSAHPWKTLVYALTKVPVNQGYTIELSAGTFIETGPINVPQGVNISGAGIDKTILKAASPLYYNPTTPAYATDKFLLRLNDDNPSNGNQTLNEFTIDGDSKHLHGGIYVHQRSNVVIDNIKVQNTNFTGIWLWDVKDSKLTNSQILNGSWGSASYCSGALNLGNVERVELNNVDINENTGYGIKAIGPNGNTNILNLKIHDSRVSVHPYGLWNGGTASNIAIELWQVNLVGSEIYNTYVDNTISLINSNAIPSTGVQTIRVHHNTLDLDTRAHGAGYGIELTVNDAEVDHNYFYKGNYGIANWDKPMKNWNIHHNTFYALGGTWPGEIVRSQSSGLHNVKLYNNTVEFAGAKTMNVIGLYGGASDNLDVKNNLFIDNNTGYSFYPNSFVHIENGASLTALIVQNNLFQKLPVGNVSGVYLKNLTSDPKIGKTGVRPYPYYAPTAQSPLLNAGVNVGFPFSDSAPEIGANEYTAGSSTPAVGTPVILDSSTAALAGTITTGNDPLATNGSYFYVAPGLGKNYYIPPPGTATFNFKLSTGGTYALWAKVKSPAQSNQNYYIYDGKGKWFTWVAGIHTTWTWVRVQEGSSATLFNFTTGDNQFQMAWADDNVKVDQVLITGDPLFIPQ